MKTGDKVVCIKSHSMPECPLVKGREYIVYDAKLCLCGNLTLNVGIAAPQGYAYRQCAKCGTLRESENEWFLRSTLFRRIEEKVNYVKLEVEIGEPILN